MPRAAVLQQYNTPFVIQDDVEWFDLEPRRVLVRTLASAFCSTDVLSIRGLNGKEPPTILGHTAVAVVEALGSAVTEFTVGQKVIVPGTPECGKCFYCGIGRPDQCSELFDQGAWPKVATDSAGNLLEGAGNIGSYAEYMNLSANHLWVTQTELPDEVLAMYGCGLLTGYGSVVTTAEVGIGDTVAVFGAGHLGLWAVQAARVAGASQIVVVDPIAERREVAGVVGATRVVDPAVEDPISVIHGLTGGRGADHAIETAGPVGAADLAVQSTRRAGTIVLSGYEGVGAHVSLDQLAVGPQGRRVLGTQNGNVLMSRDIPAITGLLEKGDLLWEPIVTRTYSLDEINSAKENCESHADICGVVFPWR